MKKYILFGFLGILTALTIIVAGCTSDPEPGTVCGNGIPESGEQCDDGNIVTETCAYGVTSCTVCTSTCYNVPGITSYSGDGSCNKYDGETCLTCLNDCGRCPVRVEGQVREGEKIRLDVAGSVYYLTGLILSNSEGNFNVSILNVKTGDVSYETLSNIRVKEERTIESTSVFYSTLMVLSIVDSALPEEVDYAKIV